MLYLNTINVAFGLNSPFIAVDNRQPLRQFLFGFWSNYVQDGTTDSIYLGRGIMSMCRIYVQQEVQGRISIRFYQIVLAKQPIFFSKEV